MSTKRVNFRIPEELLTQADVAAEVTQQNRTDILIEALREYLAEKESDDRFREGVVELYLNDEINFDVLVDVIGRQDAESVRASKDILDRGNDLTQDLAADE
jgi:metal-responsive CopG/Arc/MetJ family transcriptional regulator